MGPTAGEEGRETSERREAMAEWQLADSDGHRGDVAARGAGGEAGATASASGGTMAPE